MTTLSGRLVLSLLAIHAVLLPVLYFALDAVIVRSNINSFIDDARIQGRVFADNLEGFIDESRVVLVGQLDSAMLAGRINYAVLQTGDQLITSSLMDESDVSRFVEDFDFGGHGDDTYFMSLPIVTSKSMANLRVGFDEAPMRSHFEGVRRSTIAIIATYLIIALFATSYLSTTVVKPIRWLRRESKEIASGDYEKTLRTDSRIAEIQGLTQALEHMRSELVGANARLQEEIADREIAEAQRKGMEEQLQRARQLESLGTLAGGVAHEFNNVLQPLLLYTDLALDDLRKDSAAAEHLMRVMDLANRAKGLSHQILSFGRQSKDEKFERAQLKPVVEEAVSMIRALTPATVDIRTDLHRDCGFIMCDRAQIQQLIVNLCNNAVRALGGSGHVEIRIDCEDISAHKAAEHHNLREGTYAVLEVSDTGQGMDEETLHRAFEPFYTTQKVGEGTGLGLSVVHGIVMRHDGDLEVESKPGHGTAVRIYLPLVEEMES